MHVRWILQVYPCKSITVSRFTGKWVDYSFVLLESPYSVNVVFPSAQKKGIVKFPKKGTFTTQQHAKRALLSVQRHVKRAL